MKKRFQWVYDQNGDLSKRGIAFVVVLSIAVALFIDVFARTYGAYADTLKYEPRYTIQEMMAMGYVKVE